MIRSVLMLGCGILFGAGLAIAGMLNPAKVAGFLDIFGWLPVERTDPVVSGLILLSPIVFVFVSLKFYLENVESRTEN